MYKIIEIDDLESRELEVYTSMLENQIKHIYEPEPGLFIAESPVVIERALAAGYTAESVLTDYEHLEEIKSIIEANGVYILQMTKQSTKEQSRMHTHMNQRL